MKTRPTGPHAPVTRGSEIDKWLCLRIEWRSHILSEHETTHRGLIINRGCIYSPNTSGKSGALAQDTLLRDRSTKTRTKDLPDLVQQPGRHRTRKEPRIPCTLKTYKYTISLYTPAYRPGHKNHYPRILPDGRYDRGHSHEGSCPRSPRKAHGQDGFDLRTDGTMRTARGSVVLSLSRKAKREEGGSGEDRLGRPEEKEVATRWPE